MPGNKGKLNKNTYESCAAPRSFSSSLVLSTKLLFSSEKYRNVDKKFLNSNLQVHISCLENSEIFSSLEIPNQCISKDISVNNLEDPSNIISTGKYDNCKDSNSASISSPGLSEKADNPTLSNFNSNFENLSSYSSSSKKPLMLS